jgi:hypothetical protein
MLPFALHNHWKQPTIDISKVLPRSLVDVAMLSLSPLTLAVETSFIGDGKRWMKG